MNGFLEAALIGMIVISSDNDCIIQGIGFHMVFRF